MEMGELGDALYTSEAEAICLIQIPSYTLDANQ